MNTQRQGRTVLRVAAWLLATAVVIGLALSLRIALAAPGECFPTAPVDDCQGQAASAAYGLRVDNHTFGGVAMHGESDALVGYGMQGISSAAEGVGVGIRGQSNAPSGTGVIGTAAAPTGTTIGVFGFALSPRGTGVIGHSSQGTGVKARSSSGTGLYAESSSGFALQAVGNVTQSRSKSGLVKVLLRIEDGALVRCYNGQAVSAATAESCADFQITHSAGGYVITFPSDFAINDRYVVVSAEASDQALPCCLTQHSFPTPHQVRVGIVNLDGTLLDNPFSLVIF